MGHHDFTRRRGWQPEAGATDPATMYENLRRQHRGGGRHDHGDDHGWGGPGWGGGPGGFGPGFGSGGRRGRGGPPPWMAAFFGDPRAEQRGRGPRVRRGDVRAAILDVLASAASADEGNEPLNGYQVIQQIAERSNDAWRPSPGSVYPTISQLEDEGLVATDEASGRRSLRLTDAGRAYVTEHADELAAVWVPFQRAAEAEAAQGQQQGGPDVKAEIGQVMNAIWQIMSNGSASQRAAGIDILVDTRRRLYGVLADGPEGAPAASDEDAEQ